MSKNQAVPQTPKAALVIPLMSSRDDVAFAFFFANEPYSPALPGVRAPSHCYRRGA